MLIERHPTANAATVLEVLTSTAKRLNPKGRDDLFGWGLVDPAAALAELDSRMEDGKVAAAVAPAPSNSAAASPAAPKQAANPKVTIPPRPAPFTAPAGLR